MGFSIQVFVVEDGRHAQGRAGHAQTLQDPVDTDFKLVWEAFDQRAVRGEDENGLRHEE